MSSLIPAAIVALVMHGCASSRQYGSIDIDPPGSRGLVATGQCAPEGASYACHEMVGSYDGVVTCFDGIQVCTGGVWGPCSGREGAFSTKNVASGWLGPHSSTKALSDAGPCSSPCDPACQMFKESVDGGVTNEAGVGTKGVAATGNIPANIVALGLKSPCTTSADCQFDYHCDIPSGTCFQNGIGYYTACGGVNLTAGAPCSDIGGNPTFPICNRGNVTQPSFVPSFQGFTYNCKLGNEACSQDSDCCMRESEATASGNSYLVPCIAGKCRAKPTDCLIKSCSTNADCCGSLICNSGTCGRPKFPATPYPNSASATPCRVDYPDPILKGTCTSSAALPALAPGQCAIADFSGCSIGFQGETAAYVNGDRSITECGAPMAPGCSDNWTYFKDPVTNCGKVAIYSTSTYSQTYTATCPKGWTPQWASFAYNATMKSDASGSTSVLFQVRTAPVSADGGAGAYGALVNVASAPTPDSANCPIAGPLPCPKDLFAALGAAGAKNGVLELKVALKPSPAGNSAPTLNSWKVTYSCVAAE